MKRFQTQTEAWQLAHGDARDVTAATGCRWCGLAVGAVGASYVGRWRVCRRCSNSTGEQILARALKRKDITTSDWLTVRAPGLEVLGRRPPTAPGTKKPWEHLDDDTRREWNDAVDRTRQDRARTANENGRGCGWCGVATSRTWSAVFKATWPDGVQVQLCAKCTGMYELAERPMTTSPSWRWRAARVAMGGRPGQYREDDHGWRAYFEQAGEDNAGTDQPWAYLPQSWLRQAQVEVFGPRPSAALDPAVGDWAAAEHRRRRDLLAAESERVAAERRAERDAAEALLWR